MSQEITHKAKRVIDALLGENTGKITVLGLYGEDGFIQVDPHLTTSLISGDPLGDWDNESSQEMYGLSLARCDYVYSTGYNGHDGFSIDILLASTKPLQTFDDFYGPPSKYPVVAEISQSLKDAGYDGLEGLGAGKLVKM